MRFAEYAKAYVALAVLIASSLVTQLPGDPRVQFWGGLVVAVGGAFAVWAVPNTDPNPHQWIAYRSGGDIE